MLPSKTSDTEMDWVHSYISETFMGHYHTHTHTHPFNGPFYRTTRVSRYQKVKTNLDFTEARDSEWQWHQLGHMQVCTSLQTDNHTSTPPPHHSVFTGRMPFLSPNQQRQSTEGKKTFMGHYIAQKYHINSWCQQNNRLCIFKHNVQMRCNRPKTDVHGSDSTKVKPQKSKKKQFCG